MSKAKEEKAKKKPKSEKPKKPKPKVWNCVRCGKRIVDLPPEFSEQELQRLKDEGELICLECTRIQREEKMEKERKEREERAFKGVIKVEREVLKPIMKYAKRLCDEVTFRVNTNSLSICEMDKSRVAMLKVVAQKENLDDHIGEKKQDKFFRVDLATFDNALKKAGYSGNITSDGSFIYFKNSWGNYRMPTIDYRTGDMPKVTVKFTAKTSTEINKILNKIEWLHDKPDGVKFIAKDGKLRIKLGNGIGESLDAEVGESEGKGEAIYSIEMLKLLREEYSSHKWQIEFGTDKPLHAQKTMRVGERQTIQLDYWLANRIETD